MDIHFIVSICLVLILVGVIINSVNRDKREKQAYEDGWTDAMNQSNPPERM